MSDQLVHLLGECVPGNLSPEVFEAVARLAVYPAVEFIPLRLNRKRIEVLLLKRPKNDQIWPSKLHTPGTILRPTDTTFEDAFKRLFEDEMGCVDSGEPIFLGTEISRNRRGTCLLLEYLVVVNGDPEVGRFYDVEKLPDIFIEDQQASLGRAVDAFKKIMSESTLLK